MSFARYTETCTQYLPQCCKYLADELSAYCLYLKNIDATNVAMLYTVENVMHVNDEGFVKISRISVAFDFDFLKSSTPRQIEHYIDATRSELSSHDKSMLLLLAKDRWHKGDYVRLEKILKATDVRKLVGFVCNAMWERGYENHYTLGQQLSIRITTKLIQSGLDFKHQTGRTEENAVSSRGWDNVVFEKFLNSITSISDVIKRHRCCKKYVVLELVAENSGAIKNRLSEDFAIVTNRRVNNLCAIEVDADKNSLVYLKKLTRLLHQKIVNVLFVTDLEFYMKTNNYMFYLYNSLKLYYYCLTNKFVFEERDYEIIFLLNLITSLEWLNGGHLNSFTLEKSSIYNPLELSTRRLNSIKRAATQSRTLLNDNEIKIDFIKGKRIKTGTHYGHRIVSI
ncbi:p47 [Euproctis pseudoconspersa nucleopolyhedrovirus]|uniref:p47 n=1 Tax=Euproctis pseudoconspersa nucleopolyhedrovirus TaxID=307467 RepID=C3TWT3_9ABAC|nr:p47 [Euproctis pseudoconspersa nucleopolyhedrovirus]ACO53475.1 p47 [Euproctis pseudoconspersa nucleopolyhedrovirus]